MLKDHDIVHVCSISVSVFCGSVEVEVNNKHPVFIIGYVKVV